LEEKEVKKFDYMT